MTAIKKAENTFVVPIIRPDFIERFLTTLYRYTPTTFRVILIDQTFAGVPKYAEDRRVHVYIRPYVNLGFAKSMNIGLKMAQTKYVTAANDDIEFVNPLWWSGIMETFRLDEKIKGVNPFSIAECGLGYGCNPNTPEELVKEKEKELEAHFNRETGNFEHLPYKEKYSNEEYLSLLRKEPRLIDGITTWLTVFKKEALEYKGYFDERFYPGGGEDYDLNARFFCKEWPSGEEREEDMYRLVATTLSWVWHWQSQSRNYHRPVRKPYRRYWNNWSKLWIDVDGVTNCHRRLGKPKVADL